MRKCYSGIDNLPIHNWNKILEDGNTAWLIVDDPKKFYLQRKRPEGIQAGILNDLWKRIYADHIDKFDFAPGFKALLREKQKLYRLKLKRLKGDKDVQMFIEIQQLKVDEMMSEQHGPRASFEETLLTLKKHGYDLNPRTSPVLEYYTALQLIRKQWQQAKKVQ